MLKSFRFSIQLFCVLLIMLLMVTRFVQDGMFFDGLIYASEARNFADGTGTFWHPFYYTITYEQPPLFFPLQGLFFIIFGNGIFTERIYGFFIFSAVILFCALIWKQLFEKNENERSYLLLAVVVMLTFNSFSWAFGNNILECTMCLFDLMAVYFMFKVILDGKNKGWYLFAGISIVLAFFTKGFVGLGVLSVPFWSFIFLNRKPFSKIIQDYLLLCIPLIAALLFIIYYPPANIFFSEYIRTQVMGSLEGKRETVESAWGHFWVLKELVVYEVSIVACLIILLYIMARSTDVSIFYKAHKKYFFFFMALALSCSLPILISIKQRAFYLTPSFPYYAFGFAILLAPFISVLEKKIISPRTIKRTNYILLFAILCSVLLCVYLKGSIGRDKERVILMHELQPVIKYNSTIGFVPSMYDDFVLKAYLARYHKVIATTDYLRCDKVLQDATIAPDTAFENNMIKNNYKREGVGLPITFFLWTREK
jgi:4-amino-4-deoxy-L-arabinose transferase-like glycosyltransferase